MPTQTILIMDDDPIVTQTFERMLTLEGFKVFTADNAETRLTQARQEQPEAVILDLRMPLFDGLQFLRSLRSSPGRAQTPVAVVTGDYFLTDDVSTELRSLKAKLRFKPLWLEDLVTLQADAAAVRPARRPARRSVVALPA